MGRDGGDHGQRYEAHTFNDKCNKTIMSSITTIQASDIIANSRADINTNFSNLNTDKMELSYLDTDVSLSANSDTKVPSQKAVKAYVDTQGGANASETVRGVVEEATDAEVTAGTSTGGTGAKLFVTPAKLATHLTSKIKYGGTGADGALTVTGATAIDLGGVTHFTKNYSSISITGIGALTFTNPHANGTVITFKCTGNVTITSSASPAIDLRSLGGEAGAGSTTNLTGGAGGNDGNCNMLFVCGGGGGGAGGATTPAAGGTRAARFYTFIPKTIVFGCGGGGGGGGKGNSGSASGGGGGASILTSGGASTGAVNVDANGGNGGRGAGCLYIECAGALNITGTINAAGIAGTNAGSTGAGGGGGGGGSIIILYATLTANSGTYTVTGGAKGTGEVDGGDGGLGYSLVAQNTEFS
jgi:hypothetical protein